MPKPKRVNMTKEQVALDMKRVQKVKEDRKFSKEKFFPALCEATNNVEEATQYLSVLSSFIMEKFLGLMKDKKMSDLKLVDIISDTDPKSEAMKKMVSLFDDMTVFDGKMHFEGMKNEIQLFLSEENKKRKLSDIKATWMDEINK